MTADRVTGTLTAWLPAKKFGFVRRDSDRTGGNEAFILRSEIHAKAVRPGLRLHYTLERGPRGWRALDAHPIADTPERPSAA